MKNNENLHWIQMLDRLDEDNRKIVLDAMQRHDDHYWCLVRYLTNMFVQWREVSDLCMGLETGAYNYEDASNFFCDRRDMSGNWGDLADALGEGGTVASTMWEKYGEGLDGTKAWKEILRGRFNDYCERFGFFIGDEGDCMEATDITERTKLQMELLIGELECKDMDDKIEHLKKILNKCEIKNKDIVGRLF